MANKNTKALRVQITKACRRGESRVESLVPVSDYHNDSKPRFTTRRTPTPIRGKDGLVSCNERRNTAMRVCINRGPDGRGFSTTLHEPLVRGRFVVNKNHKYMEYRAGANPVVVSTN